MQDVILCKTGCEVQDVNRREIEGQKEAERLQDGESKMAWDGIAELRKSPPILLCCEDLQHLSRATRNLFALHSISPPTLPNVCNFLLVSASGETVGDEAPGDIAPVDIATLGIEPSKL